jgi:hypothetical protein
MPPARESREQKRLFIESLVASKACFALTCDARVRGTVLPERLKRLKPATRKRLTLHYDSEIARSGEVVINDKGFGAALSVEGLRGLQWTFIPWDAIYGLVVAWPLDFPVDVPPTPPLQ